PSDSDNIHCEAFSSMVQSCGASAGGIPVRPITTFAAIILAISATAIRLRSQQTALPQSVSHYDEAKLSKPVYRVKTEANVRVPMRDGVTLAADIYRPDTEGKFPAILVRTPYNRATAQSVPQGRWFAERGYGVIMQDVRGRWDSDGRFYAF